MVTQSSRPITDLIEPPLMAVDTNAPAHITVRRLEEEGNHTAIVTEGGKPVGIIRLATARAEATEDKLVGHLTMEPLTAVLPDTATIDDAIRMNTADMDRLPVVNADGMLIGELPRTKIAAIGLHEGDEVAVVAQTLGEDVPMTIKQDQEVVGSDGGHIVT